MTRSKGTSENRIISQFIDRLHLEKLSLRFVLWLTGLSDYQVIGRLIRLLGDFYTKHIIHGRIMAYHNRFQYNLDHSKINSHIVLEHNNALRIIRKESDLCVVDCMCRAISKNCNSPIKTCILVGPEARRKIKKHPDWRISAEQATHILQSCFEKNLIHNAIYVLGYLVEICNCCKCCCVPIMGVKKGFKSVLPSDFIAVKSHNNCIVCGICEKNCPFDAIITGMINAEKCFGCGLCSYKCPERAIKMVKK